MEKIIYKKIVSHKVLKYFVGVCESERQGKLKERYKQYIYNNVLGGLERLPFPAMAYGGRKQKQERHVMPGGMYIYGNKINMHVYARKVEKEIANQKTVTSVVHYHETKAYNASLLVQHLSRMLISVMKKTKGSKNKLQNLACRVLLPLSQTRKVIGVGFRFSGKIYGARKATALKILYGKVPFNTLKANLDYGSVKEKTRNGM